VVPSAASVEKRAAVGAQEAVADERLKRFRATDGFEVEQPGRLRQRELESGHFLILRVNTTLQIAFVGRHRHASLSGLHRPAQQFTCPRADGERRGRG